jgi:hypothetical protein
MGRRWRKTALLEPYGNGIETYVTVIGRQFLGRSVFVILDHAFQGGIIDLQFGITEKIIALLDLSSPGGFGEGVGRRVSVTVSA